MTVQISLSEAEVVAACRDYLVRQGWPVGPGGRIEVTRVDGSFGHSGDKLEYVAEYGIEKASK
jgi:hypothetical protein